MAYYCCNDEDIVDDDDDVDEMLMKEIQATCHNSYNESLETSRKWIKRARDCQDDNTTQLAL
jgi:hypothetical protein